MARILHRHKCQPVDPNGSIVEDQRCRINDRHNIFGAKMINIILRIETPGPHQLLHPGPVPHRAIGEDNFLYPGRPAKEMILDQHGIS